MAGRPVQFLTAAALAAAASFTSASTASAGCYSGCGYSYAAPVVYSAPVVYGYTYAAPVSYAAPCSPCGYSYGYAASAPMYVVNQGPTFTDPVPLAPEPTTAYEGGYRGGAYPYYAGGGVRWHRHRWYRGHGYGAYRARVGYGAYRARVGYRHGAVFAGKRFAMRHPMVGPGGIHRRHWHGAVGPRAMHRGGMHRMHHGMHRMHMHGPRHVGGMKPGVVHPMGGPKKKLP